ncbi:ABC transporter permease [Nocardia fluminea]|uniref:ABC transporter permease n=1 Tax=Nocardia fluminea TaxID=134984 RepID=UPI003812D56E
MSTTTASSPTVGVATLARFALRRERFVLPWWLFGIGALMALQSVSSQNFYDSPAKLAQLRATMSANAAVVAMGGPTRLLETVGGEVVFEIFAYLAVVVALMNMFVICRNTRSDEEAGRTELIRSSRVGPQASVVAALVVAAIANLGVALVVFVTAAATGLPVVGSALVGAAVAGLGFTVAAATTVAAQVFENPRSVYGAISASVAAAYVLRAIGDVGNDAIAWISPIGWGQRTYPFVDDRWWPLLLFAATSAVLIAVAFVLSRRRDLGAGLFGYRTGRATASRLLGSPVGLVWRLQRATVLGWCLGAFVLGAAYGSFADSIEQFLADNPEIAAYLTGNAQDAVDSYLSLTLSIIALLAAAYGVSGVLRARSEENSGRAEIILAAPVGRVRWLSGYLAVAMTGSALVLVAGGLGDGLAYGMTIGDPLQSARLAASALGYVPAVWVIVAVTAAAVGWAPRHAVAVSWLFYTYVVVALIFAEAFELPGWFADLSPLRYTALVPLEDFDPVASLALLAVVAGATGIAWAGCRRRDLRR